MAKIKTDVLVKRFFATLSTEVSDYVVLRPRKFDRVDPGILQRIPWVSCCEATGYAQAMHLIVVLCRNNDSENPEIHVVPPAYSFGLSGFESGDSDGPEDAEPLDEFDVAALITEDPLAEDYRGVTEVSLSLDRILNLVERTAAKQPTLGQSAGSYILENGLKERCVAIVQLSASCGGDTTDSGKLIMWVKPLARRQKQNIGVLAQVKQ